MTDKVEKKFTRKNSPIFSNKLSKDVNFCIYNLNKIKNNRNNSTDQETFKFKKIKSRNDLNINFEFNEKENKKIEDENQKQKLDINFFEFVDFFTYKTMMDILDSSYKLNDFTFRA